MTADEKFSDVLGCSCGVLTCQHNFNGIATCGDWQEDHCFKRLYHDCTDSKKKLIVEDEDGNEKVVQNTLATGEEEIIFLEPWVKAEDLPEYDRKRGRKCTMKESR